MAEGTTEGAFGVYVHWPFCEAKCPYCDFNSHVVTRIDQSAWARAYVREIDTLSDSYGLEGRPLTSVFFGGGTPSLMEPSIVGTVLEALSARFAFRPDIEITLEANPSSVELGRFRGYRAAGVNRVSLGVQALDDAHLRRLGRLHDRATALHALSVAKATFPRVSFDLIYARQDQSLEAWRAELEHALALASGHVSLYQLTIEPGTAFGARHERGLLVGLPEDDLVADMYALTQEMCEGAGLPAYEISNHAAPGEQSAHNLIYWRGENWLGLGPGSHGRVVVNGTRLATTAHRMPQDWLSSVSSRGHGIEQEDAIDSESQAVEYLMMSMRLTEGADLSRFARLSGTPLDGGAIAELVDLGLVTRCEDTLAATSAGRPVLNAILRRLLAAH